MKFRTVMMRFRLFGILFLILWCTRTGQAQSKYDFQHIAPNEVGFEQDALNYLSTFLEQAGSSALLIMIDGKIAFEWGATERVHTIHSIRKSMLHSLIGIKVHEGVIDTNQTIKDLGISDKFGLTEQEKTARVADLLKSRSGVYHSAAAVSEGMRRNKPERDEHLPGTHYYYNNWDFNVSNYILEKATEKSIYTLFNDLIAKPLGMHHYDGTFTSFDIDEIDDDRSFRFPTTSGFYQFERAKSIYPAYHFRMSARDMALYGNLYLNEGQHNGQQVVPKEWIQKTIQPFSVYNERYGLAYGMLWNVLMPTETRSNKSFYHTGAGIHMLAVYPSSNMVLVHRVDTETAATSFSNQDLLQVIDLVFEARKK